jgi:hypothetical protein
MLHEREILEALSSSKILTSMITPAVLISASGTLIFSTSGRLGRVFDRVHVLKAEMEAMADGKLTYPRERMAYLTEQMALQRVRSGLLQKSLAALYSATVFFIASSLAIAVNVAFGSPEQSWISSVIALLGGLFLFAASALLLYESRYNLRFIMGQIQFVDFLKERIEATETPPIKRPDPNKDR